MDSTERKKDVHNNQARSAAGAQGAAANAAAAGEHAPASSSPPPHQEVVKSFGDLPLSHEILSGIAAAGFETPTAIQQRAIAPLMAGRDVLAQAVSGSGKTATFVTAALHAVTQAGRGKTSSIILENTSDLASQVESVVRSLGRMMCPPVTTEICTGDVPLYQNRAAFQRSDAPEIVIGTMGRVIRLMRDGILSPKSVRLLVMDEGDSLMERSQGSNVSDKGSLGQIQQIVRKLPSGCSVGVLSATMSEDAYAEALKFLRNPVVCRLGLGGQTRTPIPAAIRQFRIKDHRYQREEQQQLKCDMLQYVLRSMGSRGAIVFVNKNRTQQQLTDFLRQQGFDATWRLEEYAADCTKIFVATDRYARGIDLQSVCLVINFDVPFAVDRYVHRVGRAGRFGRRGLAITFDVNSYDARQLRIVEVECGVCIEEAPGDVTVLREWIGAEGLQAQGALEHLELETLRHYKPPPVSTEQTIGVQTTTIAHVMGRSLALPTVSAPNTAQPAVTQEAAVPPAANQELVKRLRHVLTEETFQSKKQLRMLRKLSVNVQGAIAQVVVGCGGALSFVDKVVRGGYHALHAVYAEAGRRDQVEVLTCVADGLASMGHPQLKLCPDYSSALEAGFVKLYQEDVIDEDSFLTWKQTTRDAKSLELLARWFSWLEEESDDDGEVEVESEAEAEAEAADKDEDEAADEDEDEKQAITAASPLEGEGERGVCATESSSDPCSESTSEVDKLRAQVEILTQQLATALDQLQSRNEAVVELQYVAGDCIVALKEQRFQLERAEEAEAVAQKSAERIAVLETALADSEKRNEQLQSRVEVGTSASTAPSYQGFISAPPSEYPESLMSASTGYTDSASFLQPQWSHVLMAHQPQGMHMQPPPPLDMVPPTRKNVLMQQHMQEQQQQMRTKRQQHQRQQQQLKEAEQQNRKLSIADISPGDQLDGAVVSVKPYGVFVDVGGISGMVHVSSLNSDTYVQDARSMFHEGQFVTTWMEGLKNGKLRLTMINPWDPVK